MSRPQQAGPARIMTIDFWTGYLAGAISAFLGSFTLAAALMTIVDHFARRQAMAEERTWTELDDDPDSDEETDEIDHLEEAFHRDDYHGRDD